MSNFGMTEQEERALIYLLKDWALKKGWVYSWIGEAIRVDVLTEAHFTDEKGDHHNILITYDWVRELVIDDPKKYHRLLCHELENQYRASLGKTVKDWGTYPASDMSTLSHNASLNDRIMAHARVRGFTG